MNNDLSSDHVVEDSEPERERTRKANDRCVGIGSVSYAVISDDDDRDESEEEDQDSTSVISPLGVLYPANERSSLTNMPILLAPPSSPTPTPPSAQPSSRLQQTALPAKVVPFVQDSLVPECPFKLEMRKLKECVICAEDWSKPGKKTKTKWTHLLRCDPSMPHTLLIDMVRAQLDSTKSLERANPTIRRYRPSLSLVKGNNVPAPGSAVAVDLSETFDSHYFRSKTKAYENNEKSGPSTKQDERPLSTEPDTSRIDIITTPRQRSPIILNDQSQPSLSPCRTPSENDELPTGKKPAEKSSMFAKFAYGHSIDGSEAVTPLITAPIQRKKKPALVRKRTTSKPNMAIPDCPIEGGEIKKLMKCLICSEDWSKDRKVWKTKWKHIYACFTRVYQDTDVGDLKEMITVHIRQAMIPEQRSLLQSLTTKQRPGGRRVIKETTVVPVATEEGRERMKMRIEKVLASSDDEIDREEDTLHSRTSMFLGIQNRGQDSKIGREDSENEDDETEKTPAPTQAFNASNLGSRFSKYGASSASGLGLSNKEGRGWFDAANRGDILQNSSKSSDKDEVMDPSDDEQRANFGEAAAVRQASPEKEPSFFPPDSTSSLSVNYPLPVHACLPTPLVSTVSPYPTQCSSVMTCASRVNVLISPRKVEVVSWLRNGLSSALRLRGGGGQDEFNGEASLIILEDKDDNEDELIDLDSSPVIVDLIDSVEEVLSSSSPPQVISVLKPVQAAASSSWTSTPGRVTEGSKSKPAFISISDDESDDDGIFLINPTDKTSRQSHLNQFDDSDMYENSFLNGDEGNLRTDRFILPESPIDSPKNDQDDLNKDISISPFESSSHYSTTRTTPSRGKSKGKSKAPVMPDYESWECKKLQNLVRSYGLRQSSSKVQLISLLVDVWKILHPEPPSDIEASDPSLSASTSVDCVLKPKARKKRLSSENQELVVPSSNKGKKMKRITALLDGSENDEELRIEKASSNCAWSGDAESVESDLDNETEQTEEELIDIFHQMILRNEELWLRLLRYEPVGFEEMSHLAYKHGARIRGWEIVLKRWMDSQCITYWNLEVTGGRQRAK